MGLRYIWRAVAAVRMTLLSLGRDVMRILLPVLLVGMAACGCEGNSSSDLATTSSATTTPVASANKTAGAPQTQPDNVVTHRQRSLNAGTWINQDDDFVYMLIQNDTHWISVHLAKKDHFLPPIPKGFPWKCLGGTYSASADTLTRTHQWQPHWKEGDDRPRDFNVQTPFHQLIPGIHPARWKL